MKEQLDHEMGKRGLDWIMLSGPRYCNPNIMYFIGGAHILRPILVKKRGEELIVIHNSMERGEISKNRLRGLDQEEIIPRSEQKALVDPFERELAFYTKLIENLGINGRVAFYGMDDIHNSFFLFHELFSRHAGLSPVEDIDRNIFKMLRLTKDPVEVESLKDLAQRTCLVFTALFDYLRGQKLKRGVLTGGDGSRITLGDLRRFVNVELARQGLFAPEVPIISMGPDAAIPHSTGDDLMTIRAGKSLILDIFPKSPAGYVSDITRTICIGRASPRLRELHGIVRDAQQQALSGIRIGRPVREVDGLVSELFEKRGFPTIRQDTGAESGFVHSLGHGIGLELHEAPRISSFNTEQDFDVFLPGMVFTIEPGLYFPDEEIGVRIEDVVHLKEDGEISIMSSLPVDLEILPEG